MLSKHATIDEVLSNLYWHDTCVVLPSLGHAIEWWPRVKEATETRYHRGLVVTTKSAIVVRKLHRVLRLWVPYEPEPTLPLDWSVNRRGFDMASLYGMAGRIKDV